MPRSLDGLSQRALALFAGGRCSSANGSSPFGYSRVSSALKSGLVRVMRRVISLLPDSACAYDSNPYRRVKVFDTASFQSAEFGLYDGNLCMLRKATSEGVWGASVSGRLASSSSTCSSNNDVSSSLKNVWVVPVEGCGLDIVGHRDSEILGYSIEGKPNSIASSNFCGEAR